MGQRIKQYYFKNEGIVYFDNPKISDAINKVFLSKSRIRHLFKEEMGISLMNYITWKRLIHASKSLVISQENITDTAYLYGFSDSSHFSRLPFAKVASRLFTEAEGGDQHCRVGNYDLALEYILSWLRETY